MAKRDSELSKTARASLALKSDTDHLLSKRSCLKCGDPIQNKDLLPVKTDTGKMVFYHRNHYLT